MNNQEAQQTALLIAELWGVDRGPNWAAFYGAALADLIDSPEVAARAVKELFSTERFCPTPSMVIDVALGTTDNQAEAALGRLRRAVDRNEPVEPEARAAANEVWGHIEATPIHGQVPRQQVEQFVAAWRVARRNAVATLTLPGRSTPLEVTS